MTTPASDTQNLFDTLSAKRKYTRRSESQWRELITLFNQSDISLERFCHEHSIAPSGFYHWRKRFENEAPKNSSAEPLIDITPHIHASTSVASPSRNIELALSQNCVLCIKTA